MCISDHLRKGSINVVYKNVVIQGQGASAAVFCVASYFFILLLVERHMSDRVSICLNLSRMSAVRQACWPAVIGWSINSSGLVNDMTYVRKAFHLSGLNSRETSRLCRCTFWYFGDLWLKYAFFFLCLRVVLHQWVVSQLTCRTHKLVTRVT